MVEKKLKIGAHIRATRVRRGMKQSELAVRTGLQPSAISQFETGQRDPSPENLRKVAKALDVSTDYLLTGHEPLSAPGPQLQAVVRYAQSMSRDDLEMLRDFAELLAKKAASRIKEDRDAHP